MRGISKDRLLKLREHFNKDYSIVEAKVIQDLLNECHELQEPWIPLEEFLKSGSDGWCWINTPYDISTAYFECGVFYWNDLKDQVYQAVTHVMPIHKPEPPR